MSNYNLSNIHNLLVSGFSEDELRRLIQYTDAFQDLRPNLSSRDSLAKIADKLIEYSENRVILDPLLALVQEQNPARYQKHQPYKREGADPQMPHSLPQVRSSTPQKAEDIGAKLDEILKEVQKGTIKVTVFNQQGQTVQGNQYNSGRDMDVKQGDTNITQGDTITVGNNNQNIAIKAKNVTQTVQNIAHADDETKQKLETWLKQLMAELEKAPPEIADDAEIVADDAQELIELAADPDPNTKKVKRTANNFKKAAEDIQEAMPTVMGIALNIVNTVLGLPKLVG